MFYCWQQIILGYYPTHTKLNLLICSFFANVKTHYLFPHSNTVLFHTMLVSKSLYTLMSLLIAFLPKSDCCCLFIEQYCQLQFLLPSARDQKEHKIFHLFLSTLFDKLFLQPFAQSKIQKSDDALYCNLGRSSQSTMSEMCRIIHLQQ